MGWITSFEDSPLRGDSLRAGRTGGVGSSRRHGVGKMASVNVKRGVGGREGQRGTQGARSGSRPQSTLTMEMEMEKWRWRSGDAEVEMGRR